MTDRPEIDKELLEAGKKPIQGSFRGSSRPEFSFKNALSAILQDIVENKPTIDVHELPVSKERNWQERIKQIKETSDCYAW